MPGILFRVSTLIAVLGVPLFALNPAKNAASSIFRCSWPVAVLAIFVLLAVTAVSRIHIRRLRDSFDLTLAEREREARTTQDALLQGLSGATIQLQALWSRLPASPEKQKLRAIIADASKRCAEVRRSRSRQSLTGTNRTA